MKASELKNNTVYYEALNNQFFIVNEIHGFHSNLLIELEDSQGYRLGQCSREQKFHESIIEIGEFS